MAEWKKLRIFATDYRRKSRSVMLFLQIWYIGIAMESCAALRLYFSGSGMEIICVLKKRKIVSMKINVFYTAIIPCFFVDV